MPKRTPHPEYLARRLMQQLDLPGMTESEGRSVRIVLDLGFPRKPREYFATIAGIRVMDHRLRARDLSLLKHLSVPCESVVTFYLSTTMVRLHVYIVDDNKNYKVQIDESDRSLIPYQQASITINNVFLGWFPPI